MKDLPLYMTLVGVWFAVLSLADCQKKEIDPPKNIKIVKEVAPRTEAKDDYYNALDRIAEQGEIKAEPVKIKKGFKGKPGSFFDFITHEFKIILKWECNKTAVNRQGLTYCTKPETFLRYNNEFNVMGLTVKSNPDCHEKFYKTLFNPKIVGVGLITVKEAGETIVKKCYYKKYFSPFKDLPRCVRPAIFDAGVLSGQVRSIKIMQKTLGVKADGVMGPKTLKALESKAGKAFVDEFQNNFIEYLKKTKYKNKSLWSQYKNGWMNRINYVKKLSFAGC